jgi:hypothetical protein
MMSNSQFSEIPYGGHKDCQRHLSQLSSLPTQVQLYPTDISPDDRNNGDAWIIGFADYPRHLTEHAKKRGPHG